MPTSIRGAVFFETQCNNSNDSINKINSNLSSDAFLREQVPQLLLSLNVIPQLCNGRSNCQSSEYCSEFYEPCVDSKSKLQITTDDCHH